MSHIISRTLIILKPLYSSILVLLLSTVLTGTETQAQSLTRQERIDLAEEALVQSDYFTALNQSEEILKRWPRDESGLILKAAALLFSDTPDPVGAKRAIKRLPRSIRNTTRVRSLELWQDHRYGGSFLPFVRASLQMRRAKQILQDDPQNPLANLVAGVIRVNDLRDVDGFVRFPISQSSGDDLDGRTVLMEPEIDEETGEIKLVDRRRGLGERVVISNDEPEKKATAESIAFLNKAVISGPLRSVALRYLSEAVIRSSQYATGEIMTRSYIEDFPDRPEGYLSLGLIRYRQRKLKEASDLFERGVELSSPEIRTMMSDPRSIVSTSISDEYEPDSVKSTNDFWIRQDPLWLSGENENLTEHRARMVYADLVWGRPKIGRHGWATEPGQVIVRYGWPVSQVQYQDDTSEYHVMHYGYQYWLFHDMVKADRAVFFSPSAASLQGSRSPGPVNDFVLLAKELFRDDPRKTQRDRTRFVDVEAMTTVFQNRNSRTVVVPVCLPSSRFSERDNLVVFGRPDGEAIPRNPTIYSVLEGDSCPNVLVQNEIDDEARQFSLESENFSAVAVHRFDVDSSTSEREFSVSDLLLAGLIEEMDEAPESLDSRSIYRRNHLIFPKARNVFAKGELIYMYMEAYGLEVSTDAQLTLQAVLVKGEEAQVSAPLLGRIFGRREEASVSVEFQDAVIANSHERFFILETEDVESGTYTLALKVTETKTGRQKLVSRQIVIE